MQRARAAWATFRGRAGNPFAGGEYNRLMADWLAQSLSPSNEIAVDLKTLRDRAREQSRNSPLAEQFFTLLEQNVIGATGIKLQAQVRDNSGNLNKGINDKLELGFTKWAKKVSLDGMLNLRAFLKLSLRTTARDGECFIWRVVDPANPFGLSLHLWDPDQLDHTYNDGPFADGSRVCLGVHMTKWGRPLGYWFWDEHPDQTGGYGNRKRIFIPAADIIHFYIPHRYGQARGVSWFAPVLVSLRQLMGYVEAELVAARTGAAKMGFFKYREGTTIVPGNDANGQAKAQPKIDANPGSFHWLPPNIDFQEWNPQHPSTAFLMFTKTILRWISSGWHVSYNALANDLEGVNYTSLRSGLLIEREGWRDLQQSVIEQIMDRVYLWWLDSAIDAHAITLDARDPQKFADVKFRPRGWAWVDPLKDGQAAVLLISNSLDTHTNQLAERGLDLEEVLEQKAEEQRLAEQYGVTLLAPVPVPGGTDPNADDNTDNTDPKKDDASSDSSVDKPKKASKDRGRNVIPLTARSYNPFRSAPWS